MDSAQADAIVDTVSDAFGENVATQDDVAKLETSIANLKTATKADLDAAIANLKAEMFRALWIQGAGISAWCRLDQAVVSPVCVRRTGSTGPANPTPYFPQVALPSFWRNPTPK